MNEIVKHEKQVVIETFDGNLYFTSGANYTALKNALKTDRFIELNEELINTSTIKKTYLAVGEDSLSLDQKKTLDRRKKNFLENLGREPSQQEVNKMIMKLKSANDQSVKDEIEHPRRRFTEEDFRTT